MDAPAPAPDGLSSGFDTSAFLLSQAFNDSVAALAQERVNSIVPAINASFLLTSGYLVFIMQLGFALLTVGCVRAKNARSVLLKNIMDAAFGGIGYYLFGWSFAYGEKYDPSGTDINNAFIGGGSENYAMARTPQTGAGVGYASYYFQYVFAISTATIVSGAVAERVTFVAYAAYAFFLTAWTYPVLTHWVWTSSGWASPTRTTGPLFLGVGAYDTVGSGAVHMVGGIAGLAGAIAAGPRIGRFRNGKPVDFPGHNMTFYVTGVLLLWFGFFGFNPGTMGQIIAADGSDFSGVVANCAISTTLGGCFGAASTLCLYWLYTKLRFKHGVWDVICAGNGALIGVIIITSACAVLKPWASVVAGLAAGFVYLPGSWFILNVCKLDDPVDAITVHGISGAVGVLWYALFADGDLVTLLYGPRPDTGEPRHYGLFMGGGWLPLAANIIWVLVIFGWTMATMLPFFYLLKLCGVLRVSAEEEMAGMDISHHGGPAYPGMEQLYDTHEKSLHGGANGHNGDLHHDPKMARETELAQRV